MSQTELFIRQLGSLKEGDRFRLRRLTGMPLDKSLPGFDLFTGLWWPLRRENKAAPRREVAWLVAKLFGAFPLPHAQGARLPLVLGRLEPHEEFGRKKFRRRFDTVLQSQLPGLEPHLHWALSVTADAVKTRRVVGVDWVRLLDDLSIWDRADEHRRKREIKDLWAEEYLDATHDLSHQPQGANHAD